MCVGCGVYIHKQVNWKTESYNLQLLSNVVRCKTPIPYPSLNGYTPCTLHILFNLIRLRGRWYYNCSPDAGFRFSMQASTVPLHLYLRCVCAVVLFFCRTNSNDSPSLSLSLSRTQLLLLPLPANYSHSNPTAA